MANEQAGSCIIEVGGQQFEDFISFTLKRSKEETTCSGTITMSWPGAEVAASGSMPAGALVDGAKGKVMLDGQLAATIVVDTRTSQGSANEYTCSFSFRGKASAVVDSTPKHESGQENKKTPIQICKKLLEGLDVNMTDKSGGGGKKIERFIIDEGESCDRAMRRATREYSLNYYENPEGDLVLEKRGSDSGGGGQSFVLGKNFFAWTTQRDLSPRHDKLTAKGNAVPTDDKYGDDAEEIDGEAEDNKVKLSRPRSVLADGDHDKDSLKDRAKMESIRRSAQGLNVTLHLSTWSDDGGKLWEVGAKHHVSIPVDEIDDQLTVTSVTFELTPTTRSANMTLVSSEGDKGDSSSGKTIGKVLSQDVTTPSEDQSGSATGGAM